MGACLVAYGVDFGGYCGLGRVKVCYWHLVSVEIEGRSLIFSAGLWRELGDRRVPG
jgi:hypothetical protein